MERTGGLHPVLTVCTIILSLVTTAGAQYAGGSGTADDPYQIASAQDLIDLGNTTDDYDKHFILTADIDLSGYTFGRAIIAPDVMPDDNEGFAGPAFSGRLDGHGHVIRNMCIQGRDCLGLFGLLAEGAVIVNLGLDPVSITGRTELGGLAGLSSAHLLSCYCRGTVRGSVMVGGLVGRSSCSIVSCYSVGTVEGVNFVGGLVGDNEGSISSSYSNCTVSADRFVGGLVGYSSEDSSVASSFWDVLMSGMTHSEGGTGLTTSAMRTIDTYLEAGWDFTDETDNGICDFWRFAEGVFPTLAAFAGMVPSEPSGMGTAEMPYLITDANELGSVWYRPFAHYRLTTDVDLSNLTWSTAVIPWFNGFFDGNNMRIRSLHVKGAGYLGLFGTMESEAEVRDLSLDEVTIAGVGNYVGAVVGYHRGSLSSCHSGGTIDGGACVGGLAGYNHGGYISSSHSACGIQGNRSVGGLAGANSAGDISSSYSTGAVGGYRNVGGLVGINLRHARIGASYSSGAVSGEQYIGGLVGANWFGNITVAYSTGPVEGTLGVGGLAGDNYGGILACCSHGAVRGNKGVGGLMGYDFQGSIASSYSSGPVTGQEETGGLIGKVTGSSIWACFWDVQASGQNDSAGGTGLSTTQLQEIDTYLAAGWDFIGETANGTRDWWQFAGAGYPRLTVLSGVTPPEPNGAGTRENPYLITDANELGSVWYRPLAHYCLAADVDLSGMVWSGPVVPWFGGRFDGSQFSIESLRMLGAGYLGLFGVIGFEGETTGLGLEDASIGGIGDYVGSLVGYNCGAVSSSHSTGTVSGKDEVGGLVGYNEQGNISSSYSACETRGTDNVGGLLGYNDDGTVFASHSPATVIGAEYVGGLVGHNRGTVSSSYASGMAFGHVNVGGLVGALWYGSIASSYSSCFVDGIDHVGGLVGRDYSQLVSSSFWDVQVCGPVDSESGIGLGTVQMRNIDTFLAAGWDFVGEVENGEEDIWWIEEGRDYPRLWWERPEGEF